MKSEASFSVSRGSIGNIILAIIISTIICSIVISSWSIWIDEGTSAYIASQRKLGEAFSFVIQNHYSEAQMPGYILYIWSWEKLFGNSEMALRYAAIPFLIWCILLILNFNWSPRIKAFLLLLTFINPFVWYNLNEARSTMIIFFLAFISILSLIRVAENEGRGTQKSSVDISWGMLHRNHDEYAFLYFSLSFCALMIAKTLSLKRFIADYKLAVLVLSGISSIMGAYYSWTILSGAGGMRESIGFNNVINIPYEFIGFIGLGPSRNMLRAGASPLSILLGYPGIAALGIAIAALTLIAISSGALKRKADKKRFPFGSGQKRIVSLYSCLGAHSF